ncbi:MAG: phospholipid carrier-dependent glycosyltransferase [Oscillospiraceae bacterium]|nr:phospholipid carrier-dependent glycosyltransferase [Oscillospiraceae bacterium]
MKTAYLFPALLFLYIIIFMTGIPNLKRCVLPAHSACSRSLGRIDALIMAAVTLLYAGVAFTALGNTNSPESFMPMWGESVEFEFEEETQLSKAMLFSGVGEGSYSFEGSADGQSWFELGQYEQNYVSVFKWNETVLFCDALVSHVRVTGQGAVYLGELVFFDRENCPVSILSAPAALCDEQQLVPARSNFLNSTYFDEIYHARTAWEHLNDVRPYEVSHPPLGKLILSLGMLFFGVTPFGWRFMGAFLGCLMLPLIYIFAKKLFGGRTVPTLCSIVLASDFMHFVQTRIATIDTYAVFFILLMYLCMYLFVSCEDSPGSGRALLFLALSGIFFGMGAASKWTAIYAGAGLAVIWALYWIVNRRLGIKIFLKNAAFCLVFFVAVPALIYYLSYFAYGTAAGMKGPGMFFSREYAQLVLDNQSFMFNYHSGLVAEHPYSSRWYQWLLNIRPILYYLEYFNDGTRSSFGAFVNPLLCWAGLLCLPLLIYTAIFRRDKTAAFILLGYLAQLVPWMPIGRLTFEYHYFPCTVFLVLALGYVFKLVRLHSRHWKLYLGSFAAVSLLLFVMFYPAVSGMVVDNAKASAILGWLPTWPF